MDIVGIIISSAVIVVGVIFIIFRAPLTRFTIWWNEWWYKEMHNFPFPFLRLQKYPWYPKLMRAYVTGMGVVLILLGSFFLLQILRM